MNVKIIQILLTPNDYSWQGALLGLGDNCVTYINNNGVWVRYMRNVDDQA